MSKEIGYCGNHCEYCFFTECSGCKSGNPTCSYANLFDDKECPNVVCCKRMRFDGCWQCEKVDNCDTGFFSSDENDAKAYALFMKKYGAEEYTKTILNLIHKGYNYPKAFKTINNVDKILKIFEENR